MSENFEHRVKNLLDEVQFEPHAEVWINVKQAIKRQEKKRRFIFWWILPFAVAGGIFLYTYTYTYTGKKGITSNDQLQAKGMGVNIPTAENKIAEDNKMMVNEDDDIESKHNYANSPRHGKTFVSKIKTEKQKNPYTKNDIIDNIDSQNRISIETQGSLLNDNFKTASTETDWSEKKSMKEGIKPSTIDKEKDTVAVNSTSEDVKTKTQSLNNWRFGVSTELGIANKVKGLAKSTHNYSRESFNIIPNSTATGGLSSSYYSRTTTIGNFLWGAGITAQKNINKKISFQTSFVYQHQQFTSTISIYKDSAAPVLQERSTTDYKHHFLNVYTGLSFKLAQFDELNISVGSGIDNGFLLATKSYHEKYSLAASQFNSQPSNQINDYKIWQPHMRLKLLAEIPSAKRNLLQLSSYLRYSVRTFEKKPGNKDHLMSFGLTTTYFFR